ncbi:hypothetical protein HDU76_001068 [Blyttiomyces sp. JEL0837]|nr:hypothetical protein HDU76_001068 [Blyttiomyces sp. JEL0837]
MSNLKYVALNSNVFTGPVPPTLVKLAPRLQLFNLSYNCFDVSNLSPDLVSATGAEIRAPNCPQPQITDTTTFSNSQQHMSSMPAIMGGVIGSVLLIAAVICFVVWYRRRQSQVETVQVKHNSQTSDIDKKPSLGFLKSAHNHSLANTDTGTLINDDIPSTTRVSTAIVGNTSFMYNSNNGRNAGILTDRMDTIGSRMSSALEVDGADGISMTNQQSRVSFVSSPRGVNGGVFTDRMGIGLRMFSAPEGEEVDDTLMGNQQHRGSLVPPPRGVSREKERVSSLFDDLVLSSQSPNLSFSDKKISFDEQNLQIPGPSGVNIDRNFQIRYGHFHRWTHDQVVEWARAKNVILEFMEVIAKHQLDGAILNSLDSGILKEDFKIPNYKTRAAILQAVELLKEARTELQSAAAVIAAATVAVQHQQQQQLESPPAYQD